MSSTLVRRVRFLLGLGVPILGTAILVLWSLEEGVRYGEWDVVLSALFGSVMVFGPFLLNHLLVRTPTLSIASGILLLGLLVFALVAMNIAMNRGSSTAGLALLWVPFFGYPIVGGACFLDAQARRPSDVAPAWRLPAKEPRAQRWHVSVRGNSLEIVRKRGRLK